MANYKVSFFKVDKEKTEEKDEFLGSVVITDEGVTNKFTLVSKAWLHANPNCINGNKTIVERTS